MTFFPALLTNVIHHQDARAMSDVINQKIVSTTITSPPYFDMKDYGCENQIGYGQSYSEYLKDLKKVFLAIYNITKDDGTLWVIIDSFKKDGCVIPLPFDLERELTSVGWKLQDIIIWKKDRTVPWSSKGRTQRKFEYILLFSKTKNYNYYSKRVTTTDTDQLKKWWITYPERYSPTGKAIDGVWEFPIPTQGSWGNKFIRHFCPLPTALVERIINLSTNENDIVMDPFSGSGTVPAQAAYMNRQYIGFELNHSYITMFEKHLLSTLKKQQERYKKSISLKQSRHSFHNTIIQLRVLKYIKSILKYLKKQGLTPTIAIAELNGESMLQYKHIKASYIICAPSGEHEAIQSITDQITNKPPLSKFGIEPHISLVSKLSDKKKIYCGYTLHNTHQSAGYYTANSSPNNICILSSIHVDIDITQYE
ncbi:DNA-methyltransferase [Akkermansia sp.]